MDLKPLVTLLAIVNPLAIVPFFIHYTLGFSAAQRRRTVLIASFSAFSVIATCAIIGLQILDFFGISLASFQVGGGMLLLTSALAMLNAQPAESQDHRRARRPGKARRRRQHRRGAAAAGDPAADRPGQHVDRGDLRRQGPDLLAARGAGGLRRGDRAWPRPCAFRWPRRSRGCWGVPAST